MDQAPDNKLVTNVSQRHREGEAHSGDNDSVARCNSDINNIQLIGPKRTLDKRNKAIVRTASQYLKEIGLDQCIDVIIRESGCHLNHSSAERFRQHVINGHWSQINNDLNELQIFLKNPDESLAEMKFLILREQYLETLEAEIGSFPIRVMHIFRELFPNFNIHDRRQQELTSFILCTSPNDLQTRAKWAGKGIVSRTALMDKLQKFLPSSIMLQTKRFKTLLSQGAEMELQQCTYHNSPSQATLGSFAGLDHNGCSKDHFPCQTSQVLNDHHDKVWYCAFSPDGLKLATGSKDTTVIIWDIDPNTLRVTRRKTFKGYKSGVSLIAWSPDSCHLIACGAEDCAEFWLLRVDAAVCRLRRKLRHPTRNPVTACAWRCNENKFIFSDINGKICEWDMYWKRIPISNMKIKWLSCRSDGKTVLVADNQHRILSMPLNEYKYTVILQERHPIMSFSVNTEDRLILINLAEKGLHLWDLQYRCFVRYFQGEPQVRFAIYSCFGGVNQYFVASGGTDNKIYVWNTKHELPIEILTGHNKTVNCVSWNPVYHQMMVSVSDDSTIRIWGPKSLSLDS